MSKLTGKRILITGGSGSIGSTLLRETLDHDPDVVRVLDNSEQAIHSQKSRLDNSNQVDFSIGNVRDWSELTQVMQDTDVVFHTAALKHVGLVEQNPYQAVDTNVTGTRNVVRTAIETGVDSLVAVSTDKASNPFSAMGATKLLSERIVIAANQYTDSQLSCVRFGNVVATQGSVVQVFLNQIERGKDLTVTNPEMTRFAMTPTEAAETVIEANRSNVGGEVYIKKMPAFRLGDLAEAMVEEYPPHFDRLSEDISIDIVGANPGERIHEKLVSRDEEAFADERADSFVLYPNPEVVESPPKIENSIQGEYTSEHTEFLSRDRIITMIEQSRAEYDR